MVVYYVFEPVPNNVGVVCGGGNGVAGVVERNVIDMLFIFVEEETHFLFFEGGSGLVHRIGVGREAGIQRYKQGEVVFEGSQVVIKLQSRIVAAFVDDPVEYAGFGIFEQGSHYCFEVAGIDHRFRE